MMTPEQHAQAAELARQRLQEFLGMVAHNLRNGQEVQGVGLGLYITRYLCLVRQHPLGNVK